MDTPQIGKPTVEHDRGSNRRPHEHGWVTRSAHRTSEGTVLYVNCVTCGAQRVDLLAMPEHPPSALSIAAPGGR